MVRNRMERTEAGSIEDGISQELFRTVCVRAGIVAVCVHAADGAGAGVAVSSRQSHPTVVGHSGVWHGAVPARPAVLHTVSDAGRCAAYCAAHHLTPQLNPLQFIGDIRTDGLTAVLQIAFNIVFFLPLGFIMGRIWRWPLPVTAVLSFATSLFLETMQLTGLMGVFPCAYRLFDVDDLLWNTTGALIGFALAMLSLRLIPARVADMTPTTTPGFMRRLITFIIDMTLIGFAVMPTHLFVMIVRSNLPSGSNGSWQSMEPFDWTGSILFLAALILFEGVVPWLRGGCTLGGSFTHMTIETRPREGWLRVAFYVARMATLIAVVWWHSGGFNLLVFIGLGIFWLVKRQMPYDLI